MGTFHNDFNIGFRGKLNKLVLETVSGFTLAEDVLGLVGWSGYERDFLNYCLEKTIVYPAEVEEVVKRRLNELGRDSYAEHIKKKTPPDHVTSPQALAFAMRTGEISMKEIGRIQFVHGETAFTFFFGIENALVVRVMSQLQKAA